MTDIRERLRRIETAEPPDLWEGIVMRATDDRPRTQPTVVAFRSREAEARRRIATVLVAAAVFAAAAIVTWRAFRPPSDAAPAEPQPSVWQRCTNDVTGYTIEYPPGWHTTDTLAGERDPAYACRWFSPEPFDAQGNVVAEGWGYPLELRFAGPLDRELRNLHDPDVARILEEEDLTVDGVPAVRIEYETLVDLVADAGLHYQYMIELNPETTLIVHTTETRGMVGDYEDNSRIVDRAVESLRFAQPTPVTPA